MPAGTMTARRAVLRWLVMPAAAISLAAGLGPVLPAPHAAADAARMAGSPPAGPANRAIAYVTNAFSDTVTPITTATNTASPPITVGHSPKVIAVTPNGKTAYVVNSGDSTVTPITTATNTAGPPITVSTSGSESYAIAITPDGKTAYVVNVNTPGTVTPIATATNTAGPPIPVANEPLAIAITPDGKTAYVANGRSGTVTPITTATNTAGPPIPVGDRPDVIEITPDGKTAYVGNANSDTVTPIATATNTAGPPITTGYGPVAIVVTPDGKTAYVDNAFSNTVTPIATATNTAGPPIPVGIEPLAIAITPNGKTVYAANIESGTVTPITTATNTAGPPITVGATPVAIAITADGKTAYVANHDTPGTVTPIATATNTPGPPITVGSQPAGIAITPATVTHAPAFTSGAAATAAYGARFSFTVTTTGFPAPKITRTDWLPAGVRFTDNGDGTATISGTPRKAAAGVYPLTLTARNKYGTATQAFTLTVTRAPAIKKIRAIRVRVGAGLHLTVRATGYPAPALAESGPLPSGLTFTDNGNGTAVIRGTPAPGSDGRYPVTITATNTSGTATRHFKIVVSRRRRK